MRQLAKALLLSAADASTPVSGSVCELAGRMGGAAVSMMALSSRPKASRAKRRRAAGVAEAPALRSPSRSLCARGQRGEVRFFLQRVAGGLYVEREDIPRFGLHSQQSLQFAALEGFHQWCDNDPVRFEHPLLHIDLKRQADELWRLAAMPAMRAAG